MYIHYGTVEDHQMGYTIPVSLALLFLYGGNGILAHIHNLYLSRRGVLSGLTLLIHAALGEIPESIILELK